MTSSKKDIGRTNWANSEKDSKDSNGRIEEAQSRRTGHSITPVEWQDLVTVCRPRRVSTATQLIVEQTSLIKMKDKK